MSERETLKALDDAAFEVIEHIKIKYGAGNIETVLHHARMLRSKIRMASGFLAAQSEYLQSEQQP